MNRRGFITLLTGATVSWPLAARGQQAKPVVGFLNVGSEAAQTSYTAALLQGLKETGHVEGQSLTIGYRYADFQNERLPA